MTVAPPEILLVEDNPDQAVLLREGFLEAGVPVTIQVVENGVEAMAYLRQAGQFAGSPRPDIVLLDLNLPMKNGREVLREMKADQRLRSIPVLILTTSASADDVAAAYQLHANAYLLKPFEFSKIVSLTRCIHEFWLRMATLDK